MEYIAIYQAMRDVLPFTSLMKEIEFVLKLQGDTLKVLCSLFKNTAQNIWGVFLKLEYELNFLYNTDER